jgi:hypothetical protein
MVLEGRAAGLVRPATGQPRRTWFSSLWGR